MVEFGPYREKSKEVTNYNVEGLPPVMVEMPVGGLLEGRRAFGNARDFRDPL